MKRDIIFGAAISAALGLALGGLMAGLPGALGLGFFLVGAFFLQGLRKIPADPPHKAVVTKWGKRQEFEEGVEEEIDGKKVSKKVRKTLFKDEGWRFFPLYPYWYGYIKVNVAKKNIDFPPQVVRTPDMAEIEIPLSITYTPDPENLVEYLNSRGEKGVSNIIEDIIRERLRGWAISPTEGPRDWEEAMAARGEAVLILAKALLGEELPKIMKNSDEPSEIPTSIWFKHFYGGWIKSEDESFDEEKNWKEKTEKELKEQPDGDKNFIKKQIELREKEIAEIRQGNGKKKIPSLGIILNRLNLDEFKVRGELGKVAELRAKERREKMAEELELKHVSDRIKELKKLGFSNEQALEIIQTERGKVRKEIKESKWNISQETRQMIEKIGPEIIERILRR